MLKKRVRKSLVEAKEVKEKKLIQETLIKNRISIIFEGIKSEKDFKTLSEKKQLQLSLKLIQELNYLQKNGLILEQNLGSVLSKLFGNLTQTIFEPMFEKLLVPIFGKGFLTNYLKSYLTSRPSDVTKSLNDCKLFTKLITKGISEAVVMQVMEKKSLTSPGNVFIRNTMGDVLSSNEFILGIENKLEGLICDSMDKFSENAEKVIEKIKGSKTENF